MADTDTARPVGLDFSCEIANGRSWQHGRYEATDAALLTEQTGLDPSYADALVIENARPRSQLVDDGVLVVLRGVNLNPGADPEDMVSLRMFVTDSDIISVSPRRVAAVEDVRSLCERGRGAKNASDLLAQLVTALVLRMRPIIDGLEDRVEDLQAALPSGDSAELHRTLSDLRTEVAMLRRHLAPQRDALLGLCGRNATMLSEDAAHSIREAADRQRRYVEDLDSVRERSLVIRDDLEHTATAQLNRNMYVMSLAAAVFLPLSLLTGLLGINVGGIPGSESPWAFWSVTGAIVILAGVELALLRALKLL